jgi:AraC-like DNA-binding protein
MRASPLVIIWGQVDTQLPAAYALEVVELAGRLGVPEEAMLRGVVTRAALHDPSARVSLDQCAELVTRAHALTGEPALALYMGMQMRLSSHGFLGFAAMTAGTVREAIDLAVRFAATRSTALALSLFVERDTASLVIEERASLGTLREFAVIALIVELWQLGNALTGKPLGGAAECAFDAPAFVAKVPLLAGLVRFGQPSNRLVFAASLLDLPLKTADPVAMQLAREQCERQLAALVDAGFPARVRAAIVGDGKAFRALPDVAKRLHVSTRTLKRRLAGSGTTFSALLDDERRQRALLLLEDRGLSIGEVATRIGYTELPNFTRAFKRWTGATPAAYRAGRS